MDCFNNASSALNDYYALLEVEKDATTETIRKNYRKIVKKHHPDRGGNEDMYLLLSEAYECLTDPVKRQNYDIEFNDYTHNPNVPSFFKNEYDFYVKANTVPKTEEEIKQLYDSQFETIMDKPINEEDLKQRINDAQDVRSMDDVELEDDRFKKLLEENKNLTVNDLFDYIKKNNTSLIEKPCDDLFYKTDINNNLFSSFNDAHTKPLESKVNKDSMFKNINSIGEFEFKGDLNIEEILNFKSNKKEVQKVSASDLEQKIKEREEQDRLFFSNVAPSNLTFLN